VSYVLRIMGHAGITRPGQEANIDRLTGRYVLSFDNDYQRGEGMMEHTPSIHLAMHFSTTQEAWAFYRQQSRLHPTRPDGQPNRPLTAWHMMIEEDETPPVPLDGTTGGNHDFD
jgi:hypothetical protein